MFRRLRDCTSKIWTILSISFCFALTGVATPVRAQVGGSFPAFVWGAPLKASFLDGVAFDDPFAPLANPAAARGCDTAAVALEQTRPFGVPITGAAWCSGPWMGHFIARQTPAGLGFDYNAYTLAAGRLWLHRGNGVTWSAGIVPKVMLLSVAGAGPDYDSRATGYGVDAGVGVDVDITAGPFDTLSFGAAVSNGISRLHYEGGGTEATAPPAFRWSMNGAGPRLVVGVTGTTDGPDAPPRWRIGTEYTFRPDGVTLRAGVGQDGEAAVGIGVTLGGFAVDYAHLWLGNGLSGNTMHALSTRFPLSPPSAKSPSSATSPPVPAPGSPFGLDEFRLTQRITVGFGTLTGDGDAFIDGENRPVPSLNPDILLEGRVKMGTRLGEEGYVRLETGWAGQGETTFGISWRDWDVAYGPHTLQFAPAGLAYTTTSTGLGVTYAGPEGSLHVVTARRNTRHGQATIAGDDSFGPFFLGYKNIGMESEGVFIDGHRLERGRGPGDGDYYVDYEGGFLYFNRVVLLHETVEVTFQYAVDDGALAGNFTAALASSSGDRASVGAFLLREHTPLDVGGVGSQTGSTFLAYGGEVTSVGARGLRMTNRVVVTDFQEQFALTASASEHLRLEPVEREYTLQNRPVLYESEHIVLHDLAGGQQVLARNLDYTVDYPGGRIHFVFLPEIGETATVHYEYVVRNSPDGEQSRQGLETRHRIDYEGERWRMGTWLDVVDGEYVSVMGLSEPTLRLSAGTRQQYAFDGGWHVLGDTAVLRSTTDQTWTTTVGLGYEQAGRRARLRLGRDVTTTGRGGTETDYVDADFLWQRNGQVSFRFRQPLATYRGGLPEDLEAAVRGRIGLWRYSITYTHGDKHYGDKVEAAFTIPVQKTATRGAVTLATRWLYPDGFGDAPRTVHSVIGEVTFNPTDGTYARVQATGVGSRVGDAETHSYDVRGSLGGGLGVAGVVDYEIRRTGRQSRGPAGPGDEQAALSHTFTLAGTIVPGLEGALVRRQTDAFRLRPGLSSTETREHGWQASLHGTFGSLRATLSYDVSSTTTENGSRKTTSEGHSPGVSVQWEGGDVTVRAGWEQRVRDGTDRHRTIRVEPTYRLSPDAQLIVTYERITAEDLADPVQGYDAHLIQIGFALQY